MFLDLKFHDIPNTVAAACAAAADLGVWMINVHAAGGRRMMETARERLANYATPPLLVAVTILTSLGQQDIAEVGFSGAPADNVLRLARLAADSDAQVATAALRALTLTPAEILGIADKVGSLEPGKDADLAVYRGHPFFDVQARCRLTMIQGRVVYDNGG